MENWNISFDLKVEVHYRGDKKYESVNLCLKGQLQADSFLVEVIFILPSHISQGDSLVNNLWTGLWAIILILHLSLCN